MQSVTPSEWLSKQPRYPFVHLREKKQQLKNKGVKVIDFSIGDPTSPTPQFIIDAAAQAMKEYQSSGYPDNKGTKEFRTGVCDWLKKRFNANIDPETEIFPSLGAKEAVFAFPNAVSGKAVLVPTPGYPPYYSGALAAGKKVFLLPLLEKNKFLPDLSSIPTVWAKEAAIMWINYPNNPTTTLANEKFYRDLIHFCKSFDIIIASDECYSEMYRDEKPASILQYTKKGAIAFHSLSKRSNMTGWRVGFMAGDADIIKTFLNAKENMDSGCANFIQKAALEALSDETHVEEMRNQYEEKRKIITAALNEAGLPQGYSSGTFYIWQPIPKGITSAEFAERLLEEDCGLVVTPGPALALEIENGINPGEGFIRFALVPTIEDTKEAAGKLIKAIKAMTK